MSRSIIRRASAAPGTGALRQRKLDRTRGRLASELLLRELYGEADLALAHRLSETAMDLELDLLERGRARSGNDPMMLQVVAARAQSAILVDSLIIRDHTS